MPQITIKHKSWCFLEPTYYAPVNLEVQIFEVNFLNIPSIFYFRCFALRALEVGQEPLSKVRVQPPVQEWLLTHL